MQIRVYGIFTMANNRCIGKSHVDLGKVELVGSILLLIAGGIVFGIGPAIFEFMALGPALSFGGGTMLFAA